MDPKTKDQDYSLSVAVIDDDPAIRRIVCGHARRAGHQTQDFESADAFLERPAGTLFDVVFTDIMMPGTDGIELLRIMRKESEQADVIVMTGAANKQVIIEALRLGACDFLEKPVDRVAFQAALQRTATYRRATTERDRLSDQVRYMASRQSSTWGPEAIIGTGTAIRQVKRLIATAAKGDVAVLITGESGVGKELVARAVHASSSRAGGPFVAVNCSAIPESLAESLLFGHVKGAFTGADTHQSGRFLLADGGTIFLDEIGDMPLPVQTKLLRALEERVITPVGSTRQLPINVRVVSATNASLGKAIQEKCFRADLYYRIGAFSIPVPPLRERREDIPLLVSHLANLLAADMGLPEPIVTDAAITALQAYPFPGNVRELRNTIERALLISGDHAIDAGDLQFNMLPTSPHETQPTQHSLQEALPTRLDDITRFAANRALTLCNGNRAAAARRLGISRSRLYRILDHHNG